MSTRPTAEELEAYAAEARRWLEENLQRRTSRGRTTVGGNTAPTVEQVDAQRLVQRRLFQGGYAGITWPKEYGGQGLHRVHENAFLAEARGFALPDLGIAGAATMGVCAPTMLAHASPAFLSRHIPRILCGEEIVVQFFSDPDAGSDLAGVRTQAVRRGDRWILNGSKIWSSGAYYADIGMCLARTNWDVPKHRGLTWFAVPTRAEGVTIERIRQINGNSEFCQEFFTDVELTDDDLIGEVDDGWTITQTMLLHERGGATAGQPPRQRERTGVASDAVAAATAAGRLDDPMARDAIARLHVDDLVRSAFNTRLGGLIAADARNAGSLASYAKLSAGILDPIRADLVMRIAGPDAIAWESDRDRGGASALGLLNSRFMSIAGGTNEVQRNSVGERVLGLPREPSFDSRKPFRDVVRDAASWDGRVG